jgi:hypothetical protein
MPKSTLSIVFSKLETSLGDGISIARHDGSKSPMPMRNLRPFGGIVIRARRKTRIVALPGYACREELHATGVAAHAARWRAIPWSRRSFLILAAVVPCNPRSLGSKGSPALYAAIPRRMRLLCAETKSWVIVICTAMVFGASAR